MLFDLVDFFKQQKRLGSSLTLQVIMQTEEIILIQNIEVFQRVAIGDIASGDQFISSSQQSLKILSGLPKPSVPGSRSRWAWQTASRDSKQGQDWIERLLNTFQSWLL